MLHAKQTDDAENDDDDETFILRFKEMRTIARCVCRLVIGVNALSTRRLPRIRIPVAFQTVHGTRCS